MKKALIILAVSGVVLIVGAGVAAWYERDRVSVEVLNRALSEYGITIDRVSGLQLGRERLRFAEMTWRMPGSAEMYRARHFDAQFRLSPFYLKRISLDELQLWIPTAAAEAAAAPQSIAQWVGQWQRLPIGEVDVGALRIDRRDPVESRWQRQASEDRLALTYQDLKLAAAIGREPVMTLVLQLSRDATPLLNLSGEFDSEGVAHPLHIAGKAQIAPLWQLLQQWALLPADLSTYVAAADGALEATLSTTIADDPSAVPAHFSAQIQPATNAALQLRNLPAEITTPIGSATSATLTATLAQPLSLQWDGALTRLQAGGINAKLTLPQHRANLELAVTSAECTAVDQCRAEIKLRGAAKLLRSEGLQVAAPLISCAGQLSLRGEQAGFDAGKDCRVTAQQLTQADIVVGAPDLQLGNTRWQYRSANQQLRLDGRAIAVQLAGVKQADISATGSFALRDLHAEHTLGQPIAALTVSAGFAADKLKIALPGQWLPVLRVQGELKIAKARAGVSGELRTGADKPLLTYSLAHRLDTDRGSGRVELNTDKFDLGERKLSALLRGWPYPVDVVAGSAAGGADLQWHLPSSGLRWQGSGNIDLRGLAGKMNDIAALGVDAAANFTIDNGELSSRAPAQLRIASIDVGLPVGDVALDASFDTRASRYRVHSMDAQLLGGSVHAGAYDYLPEAVSPAAWEVGVNGILLERALALAAFDSVTGQGRIDGMLPLAIAGDSVTMEDGWLAGRAGGVLSYVSATGKVVAAANPSLSLVTEALSNYHYETLRADASLDKAGNLKLGVAMRGVNPQMRGGQRINLNLNLQNNIPDLLRTLRAGRIVDDMLEQQLKKRR